MEKGLVHSDPVPSLCRYRIQVSSQPSIHLPHRHTLTPSFGDLLFGIDTGSFGALQVLPSWLRDFGEYNAETDTYFNPTWRTSLMNSIVFLGSFVGCATFEPICERFGYKVTIMVAGCIQVIAVIGE